MNMHEEFKHYEEFKPFEPIVLPQYRLLTDVDPKRYQGIIELEPNQNDFEYFEGIDLSRNKRKELYEEKLPEPYSELEISSINSFSLNLLDIDTKLYINKIKNKISHEISHFATQKYLQKDVISGILGNQHFGSVVQTPPANTGLWLQSFGNVNDLVDLDKTKPEELPEMALPILEFIDEVQPHIVIGCDRGGRLFSLAMHAAWRETRAGQPFPTLDGKLHFARISKSEDPDVLQEKIDQIVGASKLFGEQRGNVVDEDEQLRVLFVDDWVIGGGTKRLTERLMKKYGAQTYFAVLCGDGADVAGRSKLKTRVSWHDRPEEIGVNYLSSIKANSDGSFTQKQEVVAVRGLEAVANRRKIQEAARQLDLVRVLTEVA
jgi:hypothetical protein